MSQQDICEKPKLFKRNLQILQGQLSFLLVITNQA